MLEREDSELSSEFAEELNASESDSEAQEYEASTESGDYDEWTGFCHSSGAGDLVPPPTKPQEIATFALTPQLGSKYVPPHLRKTAKDPQNQPSESLIKLTKQLKGLLNRYALYLLFFDVCTKSLQFERAEHCVDFRRYRRRVPQL